MAEDTAATPPGTAVEAVTRRPSAVVSSLTSGDISLLWLLEATGGQELSIPPGFEDVSSVELNGTLSSYSVGSDEKVGEATAGETAGLRAHAQPAEASWEREMKELTSICGRLGSREHLTAPAAARFPGPPDNRGDGGTGTPPPSTRTEGPELAGKTSLKLLAGELD